MPNTKRAHLDGAPGRVPKFSSQRDTIRSGHIRQKFDELRQLIAPGTTNKTVNRDDLLEKAVAVVEGVQGQAQAQLHMQGGVRRLEMAVPLGLVGDVVLLLDHDAKVTTALPATAQCLGVPINDLIGRNFLDLLYEPQVEEVMAALNEAKSGTVHFDCRFKVSVKEEYPAYYDPKPDDVITSGVGHQWYKATAKPVTLGRSLTILVSARQWQDVRFGGVGRVLNLAEPGHRHYKLTRMDGSIVVLLSAPTGRLFAHPSNIFFVQNPIHFVRPMDLQLIARIYREGLEQKKPTAAVVWFQDPIGGWNCYYGGLIPCVNKQTGEVEYMYGWGKHVDYSGWEPTEQVPEIEFPSDHQPTSFGQVIEFDGYDDLVNRCEKMSIRQEECAIEEDEWREAFEAENALAELDAYKVKFGPRQPIAGSGQHGKKRRTLGHIPEQIIQAAVKKTAAASTVSSSKSDVNSYANVPTSTPVATGIPDRSRSHAQNDISDSGDLIGRPIRKDSAGRPMTIDTHTSTIFSGRSEASNDARFRPIREEGLSRSPHPDDWWDPDESLTPKSSLSANSLLEIGPPDIGKLANIANEGWNLGLGIVPPPLWVPGASMFSYTNQTTSLAPTIRNEILDLVPLDQEIVDWLTNETSPSSTASTGSEASTMLSYSPSLGTLTPQEIPSPAKTVPDNPEVVNFYLNSLSFARANLMTQMPTSQNDMPVSYRQVQLHSRDSSSSSDESNAEGPKGTSTDALTNNGGFSALDHYGNLSPISADSSRSNAGDQNFVQMPEGNQSTMTLEVGEMLRNLWTA